MNKNVRELLRQAQESFSNMNDENRKKTIHNIISIMIVDHFNNLRTLAATTLPAKAMAMFMSEMIGCINNLSAAFLAEFVTNIDINVPDEKVSKEKLLEDYISDFKESFHKYDKEITEKVDEEIKNTKSFNAIEDIFKNLKCTCGADLDCPGVVCKKCLEAKT